MKYILDLNGKEYTDVIESVEFQIENEKYDLIARFHIIGILPEKDSGWDEVVKTASKDNSSKMPCKVYCIDDEDRIVRQYEINEIFFREYRESYDTPDGKARFDLWLNRLRRSHNPSEATDIMTFTENDF